MFNFDFEQAMKSSINVIYDSLAEAEGVNSSCNDMYNKWCEKRGFFDSMIIEEPFVVDTERVDSLYSLLNEAEREYEEYASFCDNFRTLYENPTPLDRAHRYRY